jgi:lipopolysaccharide biosynthesis regulator YciM
MKLIDDGGPKLVNSLRAASSMGIAATWDAKMPVITDRQKLKNLSESLPPEKHASIDVAALIDLAQEAVQQREFGHAEDILQGALVIDPDSAPAWSLLGRVEHELGANAPAVEAYANAVMLNDSDLNTALALAQLQEATGAKDKARALVTWLMLACENDPSLLQRAKVLFDKLQESTIG